MSTTRLFLANLALIAPAAGAAEVQQREDRYAPLVRAFDRKYVVTPCEDETAHCEINGLTLPPPKNDEDKECFPSVLPLVRYSRDGRSALGAEFVIAARDVTETSSESVRSKRYVGIVMVEKSGIQDICVTKSVTAEGRTFALKIGEIVPETLRFSEDAFSSPQARLISQRKIDRSAIAAWLVNALFGSSSNGIVRVTIQSQKENEEVAIGAQLIGRTLVKELGLPLRSLDQIRVKTANKWKPLKECVGSDKITGGAELSFRC